MTFLRGFDLIVLQFDLPAQLTHLFLELFDLIDHLNQPQIFNAHFQRIHALVETFKLLLHVRLGIGDFLARLIVDVLAKKRSKTRLLRDKQGNTQ